MYAVIFRSTRTEHSEQLYQHHSEQMEELVKQVPGFISSFSHRDPITQSGVTVVVVASAVAAAEEEAVEVVLAVEVRSSDRAATPASKTCDSRRSTD